MNKLTRVLYRNLLHTAKVYDSKPAFKTRRTKLHLKHERQDEQINNPLLKKHLKEHSQKIFGDRIFYLPIEKSFADLTREGFKINKDLQGEEKDAAIDAGYVLLRNFNNALREEQSEAEAETETKTSPPATTKTNLPKFELTDKIEPGVLLIAHPCSTSVFKKSIVLICDHNDTITPGSRLKTHTSGVILNKKMTPKFQNDFIFVVAEGDGYTIFQDPKILKEMGLKTDFKKPQPPKEQDANITRYGGPCHGTFSLYKSPQGDFSNQEQTEKTNNKVKKLPGGMIWGESDVINQIKTLQQEKEQDVKKEDRIVIYKGNAQWEKDQLSSELERGSWVMVKCNQEDIWKLVGNKEQDEVLWDEMLKSLGGEYE
ncbi:transcriptional regulator AlgH, partial [Acrasis kona]